MDTRKRPPVLGLRLSNEAYDKLDEVLELMKTKADRYHCGLGRGRYKWAYTYQDAILFLLSNASILEVVE